MSQPASTINPQPTTESASTPNGPTTDTTTATPPATTSTGPAWSSQMSSFPASSSVASTPSFPQFSASTAAILERLQGKGNHASQSAAFEAKKAEILQNYVTSDKLPTPPPITNTGRRGKGGRVGTPSALKTEVSATPSTKSPARVSARGRGKAKGRGGRGGKRKRNDSEEDSNVSYISLAIDNRLMFLRTTTLRSLTPTRHYLPEQSLVAA